MKYIFIFLLLGSFTSGFAQQKDFTGTWQGKLEAGGGLRIVFTVTSTENGLASTMQSPDQTEQILPTDTTYSIKDSLFITAKRFGISYKGKKINDTIIEGVFIQGAELKLDLTKNDVVAEIKRPQTPKPPYPYHSENSFFYNTDSSLKFGATLTWPKIPEGTNYVKAPTYPAVVLITGSGAQDRDENIFNHKSFAVIADALTKQGFAVLRYDDRGIGESTGNFETATSADFANDVKSAIDYLKTLPQIDTERLGLIGHSEGGMIAPMVGAERKEIKYMVLLAGPGIPIIDLMKLQIDAVSKETLSPMAAALRADVFVLTAEEINKNKDSLTTLKNVENRLNVLCKTVDKTVLEEMELTSDSAKINFIKENLERMSTVWFKYFLTVDPTPYLEKTTAKILAINGSKDVQVFPTENLNGIEKALKKSKSPFYTTAEIEGLNHLFQTCKTCKTGEYAQLEETFSPVAIKVMTDWLQKNVLTN